MVQLQPQNVLKIPKSHSEFKSYMFPKFLRENYVGTDSDPNIQTEVIEAFVSSGYVKFPISFLFSSAFFFVKCSKAAIIEMDRRQAELNPQQLSDIYQFLARLNEDELIEAAESSITLAYWTFETVMMQCDYRPQRFLESHLDRLNRVNPRRTQDIRHLSLLNLGKSSKADT